MANEFVVKNGLIVSGSARVQGSITATSFTGSFSGSINTAVSASYALTASYALNAGDSVWTGSAGNIYYNGGNVGIGTTGPAAKLDVYSAGSGTTLAVGRATGASSIKAGADAAGGYLALDSNGGAVIINHYANNDVWLVTGGGSVGVGTSSPGYKLDVNGTSGFRSDMYVVGTSTYWYNGTSYFQATNSSDVGILKMTNNSSPIALQPNGGNVGIGTTNPSGKLHIADDGPNALKIGDTQVSTIGETNDGSYPGMKIVPYNSNIHIGISSTNDNKINLWHGGSNYTYWQQTSTYSVISNYYTDALVFQVNGGNVGIGTTTPYEKLEVNGAISATGAVNGTSAQGHSTTLAVQSGTSFLYAVDWGAEFKPISVQAKTISLETGTGSTTSRLFIDNSGNVGIGTSSPSQILETYKSTNGDVAIQVTNPSGGGSATAQFFASNGTTQTQFFHTGTSYSGTGILASSAGLGGIYNNTSQGIALLASSAAGPIRFATTTSNTERMRIAADGNVGIGTNNPNEKLHVAGNINAYANGGIDAGLFASTSGGSTTIAIRSNGITHFNGGNVGIGTTSPSYRLAIQNSGGSDSIITEYRMTNGNNAATFRTDDTVIFGIHAQNSGDIYIKDTSDNVLFYGKNGGGVGIGTTSPATRFNVVGGRTYLQTGNEIYTLGISRSGANAYYLGVSNASSPDLYISNNAGTTRVTVTDAGNVGIGTTNPNALLVLDSGEPRFRMNIAGTNHIIMNHDGTTAVLRTESNTPFTFGTNGSEKVRIAANGNVGIGTTNPVQILHVNGNIYMPSTNYITWNNGDSEIGGLSSGYGIRFSVYDGSATMVERMRITSAGSVGIGTTSPVAKLTVLAASTGYSSDSQIKISDTTTSYYGGLSFDDAGSTRLSIRNSFDGAGSTIGFGFGSSADKVQIIDGTGLIVNEGNVGIGVTTPQAKLQVSGSTNVLNVRGSGSATTSSIFSVDGNNGRLFEVSDDLSNSLFSVNTIAGLPVIEAFADYSVTMGTYGQYVLQVTGSNVGIGSSAPGAKLDVNGNVRATSFTGSFSGSATNAVSASYALTASYALNAGDSVWTGSAGNIYYNQGNVGVGTTSPSSLFHVFGTTPTVRVEGSTTNSAKVDLAGPYTTWVLENQYINGANNDMFRIYNSALSADAITINRGSNNVGIGSTNPSQKLVVVGNTAISGVTYTDYIQTYSGTSIDFRHQDASVVMRVDTANARVGIGTTSPSQKLDVSGNIQGTTGLTLTGNAAKVSTTYAGVTTTNFFTDAGGGVISVDGSNKISLRQGGVSGTDAITIAGTGNVGIGTTNPGAKLEVYNSGAAFANIKAGGGDYAYLQLTTPSSDNGYLIKNTATGNSALDKSLYLWNGNGPIQFVPNATIGNAVTINTSGNVGIGITNPTTKLHVVGESKLTGAAAAYTFFDQANGTYYSVWYRNNNITYLYDSYLNSNPFVINASGNVGIGITSPNTQLHLFGTGDQAITIQSSTTGASTAAFIKHIRVTTGSARSWWTGVGIQGGTDDSYSFYDATAGAERMRIAGTGYVGIGTTNPQNKLVVTNDATYNSENSYSIAAASATNPDFKTVIGYDYANDIGVIAAVRMGVAWKNLAILPTGGSYVGIGTTNPTRKLDVNGSSIFRDFTTVVATNGNPVSNITWLSTDSGIMNIYTGGSATVQLNSNGVSYFNGGSVGIGTTSPTRPLTVKSSNIGIRMDNSSNSNAGLEYYVSTGTFYNWLLGAQYNVANTFEITPSTTVGGTTYSTPAFVVNANGNVGIGTSSPASKLQIGSVGSTGYSVGNGLAFGDGTRAGALNVDSSGTTLYSSTNLIFSPGTTEAVRITSAGNVGIGTTSPADNLHIFGTGDRVIKIENSGTYLMYAGLISNEGYIGSSNATPLGFYTNNVNRMYINTSGNVGIGTTNPAAKLDVSTSTYGLTTNSVILQNASGDTRSVGQFLGDSSVYNQVGVYGTNTVSGSIAGIKFNWYSDNWMVSATRSSGTAIYGFVISKNGSEKLVIGTDGNVGIGSTSPTQKLDVVGTIAINGAAFATNDSNYTQIFKAQSNSVGMYLGGSGDPGHYYDNTYHNFRSAGGGTTYAVINNNGNLGIGTASPGTKLQVEGNIYSNNVGGNSFTLNSYGANYGFISTTANNTFSLGYGPSLGTLGTPVLTWNSSGNVGIGTTNPATTLQVNGTARATRLNSTGGVVDFDAQTGNNYIQISSGEVSIANNGNVNMTITSAGSVGIGITNPARKLHVSTTGNTDGLVQLLNGDTSYGATTRYSRGGSYNWDIGIGASATNNIPYSYFGIADGGITPRFVIAHTTGYVGIGTTSPSTTLDIAGNAVIQNGYNMVIGSTVANPVASTSKAALTLRKFTSGNASTVVSASYYLGVGGNEYTIGSYRLIGFGYAEQSATTTYPAYIGYKEASTSGYTYGDLIFGTRATYGASDDPSERMRITYEGNVGINTTSPSQKLEVSGGDALIRNAFIGLIPAYGANYASFSHTSRSTTDKYSFLSGNAGDTYVNASNGYSIHFRQENIDQMTITGGGKVGIGTNSPAEKLHVVGGIIRIDSNTGGFYQYNTSGVFRSAFYDDGTVTSIYGDGDGSNSAITINSGNIGIGTTSPAYKTEVATALGNYWNGTSFTGTTAALAISNTQAGGYDPNLLFRQADSAGTIQLAGGLGMAGTGPWTSGNSSSQVSDMYFLVRNSSGGVSERMRINSGGNVGIGTTNASYKLDVNVASNSDALRVQQGGSSRFILNGDGVMSWGPSANVGVLTWDSSIAYVGALAGSALGLYANGSEKVRITTGGNVGIGTTSPSYKLDVNGIGNFSNGFSDPSSETGYRLKFYDNGGTYNDPGIGLDGSGGAGEIMWFNAYSGFYWGLGTGGTKMKLDSSGNLGIGTTNPQNNLHVSGAANGADAGNIRIDSTSQYGGLVINENTTFRTILGYGNAGNIFSNAQSDSTALRAANYLHLGASSAATLTINGSDNVGIGTTSPSYKLHLEGGNQYIVGGLSGNNSSPYTSANRLIFNNDYNDVARGPNKITLYDSSWLGGFGVHSDTLAYYSGGTHRWYQATSTSNAVNLMSLLSDGNLGIGTASPAFKLDVNGNAAIGTKLSVGTTYSGFTANIAGTTYIIGASVWVNDGYGYANASSPTTGVFPTSGNDVDINTLGSTSLKVKVGGFVGIGTTNPLFPLDVIGTVRATTFIETSARKYKTNIQNIEPQLDKVLQLQPVTFDWKDKKQENTNIGLIADDVINIYPEFVVKNSEDEIEGIDYSKLTAVLIQSVKELKEIIDVQQQQINALLNK